MRTTLNLDSDVLEAARSRARTEHRALGVVVSELARRGLAPLSLAVGVEEGFPVFQVDPDAAAITNAMVDNALEEG